MLLVAIEPVTATVATVAVPVQNPEPPPGRGEEFGKASPVAAVVIIALFVATALLIRNMTKRITRLPASFDPPAATEKPAAPASDADPDRT